MSKSITVSDPRIAWHRPCVLCGDAQFKSLFTRYRHAVQQCKGCGLRFLSPQPDDTTLAGIYTAEYFLGERNPESEARVARLKRATASLYVDLLISHLGGSTGRLLEIGCGSGQFLLEAQSRG